jgi:RND family efflux transporter MFP subunit
MNRLRWISGIVVISAVAGVFYLRSAGNTTGPAGQSGQPGAGAAPGGMRGMGAGGRGFAQPPMTVEVTAAGRTDLSDRVLVVGNLIGAQTVELVPKVSGRLQDVRVRLGDRVSRGQPIAKIEDHEILEQVKQSEGASNVSQATIRQREADLKLAQTNVVRTRSLFSRQLIPQQTLDDAEARDQAASAQLDLARAQFDQTKARLDELKINLANTIITSPVDGFVGRRSLDPGAWVTTNSAFISVVDVHVVRLIVNIVEKDLRRMSVGAPASVEVDAYPGETFPGRIARIAPVLDPSTRTAQIEIEVPNGDARLKPGMYARVRFIVEERKQALTVPVASVVDLNGKRGVFLTAENSTAKFFPVVTGLEDQGFIEITQGVQEGDRIITTGAAGLRDGDRIVLAGQAPDGQPGGPRGPGRSGGGRAGMSPQAPQASR